MAEQGEGNVRKLFEGVRLGLDAAVAKGEGVSFDSLRAVYDSAVGRRLVGTIGFKELGGEEYVALETLNENGGWNDLIRVTLRQDGDWLIETRGVFSDEEAKGYPRGVSNAVFYVVSGRKQTSRFFTCFYDYKAEAERVRMVRQGYKYERELPERINMEATVAKFLEQVGRRDFSTPVWVEA